MVGYRVDLLWTKCMPYKRFLLYWNLCTIISTVCNIASQEAVKLLGAICLIPPDGHEKTLEAITIAAEMKGGERYVGISKLSTGCP